MEYRFGENGRSFTCEARSFETAFIIYKNSVFFPEQDVYSKHVKTYDYCSVRGRNFNWKFKVKAPKIPVFFFDSEKNEWKKFTEVLLSDCLNFSYQNVFPERKKLTFSSQEEILPPTVQYEMINSDIQNMNKSDMRSTIEKIEEKLVAIEEMKDKLKRSIDVLHSEVSQRQKTICFFETYLGTREEVVQLKSGVSAADSEPLYLFQQVLYMDEEVGIWEDGGIDFKSIEKFDTWISKKYKNFLYKEKSVCVFRVRRNKKEYGDAFINIHFNFENFKTYFLIRNGQNLYRIYSAVSVSDVLFPRKDAIDKIFSDHERDKNILSAWDDGQEWTDGQKYFVHRVNKDIRKLYESMAFGLIAIQGLIDRTDILGTGEIKRLKLLEITTPDPKVLVLVRDAESYHWIGDGRIDWRTFIKKNRATIEVGTRVVLKNIHTFSSCRDDQWRTSPYRQFSHPSSYKVYTIEEVIQSGQGNFLFRYMPSNTCVFRDDPWDDGPAKKRIPFRVYSDELINFDLISIEECEYYINNRYERKDYLDILPILTFVLRLKKEEQEQESNFIKLVHSQTGSIYSNQKVVDAIQWWKLKNKWKRALTKDDAKALRMIIKHLNWM